MMIDRFIARMHIFYENLGKMVELCCTQLKKIIATTKNISIFLILNLAQQLFPLWGGAGEIAHRVNCSWVCYEDDFTPNHPNHPDRKYNQGFDTIENDNHCI